MSLREAHPIGVTSAAPEQVLTAGPIGQRLERLRPGTGRVALARWATSRSNALSVFRTAAAQPVWSRQLETLARELTSLSGRRPLSAGR